MSNEWRKQNDYQYSNLCSQIYFILKSKSKETKVAALLRIQFGSLTIK